MLDGDWTGSFRVSTDLVRSGFLENCFGFSSELSTDAVRSLKPDDLLESESMEFSFFLVLEGSVSPLNCLTWESRLNLVLSTKSSYSILRSSESGVFSIEKVTLSYLYPWMIFPVSMTTEPTSVYPSST